MRYTLKTPYRDGTTHVFFNPPDFMPPRYVTEARRFNLAIPHLRSFVELGASASGVIRVTSTVTYPSHTTVVTDVLPAARGIVTNTTFDPLNTNREG